MCNIEHLNGREHTEVVDSSKVCENNSDSNDSLRKEYLKWINHCIYTCRICNKEFYGDMALYNHIKNASSTHGMDFTSYKAQFGGSMTKKVMFECPLCHTHILHNLKHLTAHIKLHNNMKLFNFYIQHVFPNDSLQPIETKFSKENQGVALSNKHDQSKLDTGMSSPFQDADIKRAYDAWSNMSKFRCKACPKTFLNPLSLGIHIRLKHKLSKVQYKAIYKNCSHTKGAIKHLCQICDAPVNQNQIVLAKHLKRHNTSVFKYYIKYIHGQESRTATQDNEEKVEENGKTYKVVEHSSFDEWVNATLYGCQICDQFESRNYLPLISHLEKAHQTSKARYMKKYGSLITKKVMHNCHLCNSSFQQSYNYLYNHLNEEHHVNVHDYYTSYISSFKTKDEVRELEKKENVVVDIKESEEKVNDVRNPNVPQEQKIEVSTLSSENV